MSIAVAKEKERLAQKRFIDWMRKDLGATQLVTVHMQARQQDLYWFSRNWRMSARALSTPAIGRCVFSGMGECSE